MSLLLQKFMAWVNEMICRHSFVRMKWHGLSMEPHLMLCKKCQKITILDHRLTDQVAADQREEDNGKVL